jgi:PAS domain S-box-containing protein
VLKGVLFITLAEISIGLDQLPVWLRMAVMTVVIIGIFERLAKPVNKIHTMVQENRVRDALKEKTAQEYYKKIDYIFSQCSPNGKTTIFDKVDYTVEELSQLRIRQRSIIQVMDLGVYELAPNGEVVYVNTSYCRIIGLAEEECMGLGWLQVIPQANREKMRQAIKDSKEFHRDYFGEFLFQRTDGTLVNTYVRFMWAHDAKNNVLGGTGTVEIISERKPETDTISKPENGRTPERRRKPRNG